MKIRYFIRRPRLLSPFAQDRPTLIMCGRFAHFYTLDYRMWFIVDPAPPDPMILNRSATTMVEVNWKVMRRLSGRRFWLEFFEDKTGVRLKPWASFAVRWIPVLKRIGWIRKLSRLDEDDSEDWWRERQQPQIGVRFGPQKGLD